MSWVLLRALLSPPLLSLLLSPPLTFFCAAEAGGTGLFSLLHRGRSSTTGSGTVPRVSAGLRRRGIIFVASRS